MPTLLQALGAELAERREKQLYRARRIAESAQQVEMQIDGHQLITFCSNDYLGLANHPAIKQAVIDGVNKWGVGSGAAHLVNGHSGAHHSLEEELAIFTRRERALLFSTGYMANLGIATALLQRNDTILEDRLNHASLLDAGLLSGARFSRYAHANPEALQQKLIQQQQRRCLVMTDGVFSMEGDIAPLTELVPFCQQQQACLMVDDAHGFGVLGDNGAGTLEQLGLTQNEVPILMATLGKAAGVSGAFVAGSEELIDTLIQKARTYIYTTASPPALAEASRVSLKLIQKDQWRRERLLELIQQFKTIASQRGWQLLPSNTPIQAIIIGNADQALTTSAKLLDLGLLAPAIRPPTVPVGTARIRITFSATHTDQHFQQLIAGLSAVIA